MEAISMSRRPAHVTQADVARVIRAAKQTGAEKVEVKFGNQTIVVSLGQLPGKGPEAEQDIVL